MSFFFHSVCRYFLCFYLHSQLFLFSLILLFSCCTFSFFFLRSIIFFLAIFSLSYSLSLFIFDTHRRYRGHFRFGHKEKHRRWLQCANSAPFPLVVGAHFIDKFFSERGRESAQSLIDDVRAEFVRGINSSDWLDQETKVGYVEVVT